MDNAKIYVPVDETWDFFEDNIERFKETSVEVASNGLTKIYMTENEGKPQLILNVNGVDRDVVNITSSYLRLSCELKEKLTQWYADYILCDIGETDESLLQEGEPEDSQIEIDNAIMREDELVCALDDFLCTALTEDNYEKLFSFLGYDMFLNVLETICDTLETSYGVSVYWPRVEEDEDGAPYVVG